MAASFSFNYQLVLERLFPEKLDITMTFTQLSLLNAKKMFYFVPLLKI